MRAYNFGTHWITTDQILTGYIDSFEITLDDQVLIDNGASLEAIEGTLVIGITE
jgi:hypothetical protein